MIGKKYTESGGFSMKKTELDIVIAKRLGNPNIRKGIEMFEKYVGRINWMHPEQGQYNIRGNKKYRVINKLGEVVFESDNISNIAKEFCLSKSRVSNSINTLSFVKGEYLIERCEDE